MKSAVLILVSSGVCAAFHIGTASHSQLRNAATPQMGLKEQQKGASSLLAASLALALATSSPVFTPADPLPVVERSTMIVADEPISEAQARFLEERKKLKQAYDEEQTYT